MLKKFASKANPLPQLVATFTMALFCTACAATSRMETAVISESQGLPCFSIPKNAETKDGIPLYGILVSEIKSADWKTLPDALWEFSMSPPGSSLILRPENCIRYGDTPASAEQGKLKPLEPFHVYAVGVAARPEGSNVVAYGARFCIKPMASGKIAIQMLAPNSKADDSRCAKPVQHPR